MIAATTTSIRSLAPSSVASGLSRRRYQRGQLIQEHDRWLGRWYEDVIQADGTIKRPRKQEILGTLKDLPTKRLAQRALDKRLEAINSLEYKPLRAITFATFAEKWMRAVMIHHKPSTQDGERMIVNRYLMPAFGECPMKSVTLEMIQGWVNAWTLGPKTLRNALKVLTSMWDIAKAWAYVTHNPFPRGINGKILLRLPALTKPKAYNYTLEETLAIIDQAPGKYKLLFRTAAEAGIRPGELSGMRRTDLVGRTIYLSQSVYRQKIQTPKTANAVRAFTISQDLADQLRRYMGETDHEPNHFGLVWTNEAGNPLAMHHVRELVLNPILERLGIREKIDASGLKAGFYPFRHMNATEQARRGVPLKTIQKRIGHAIGSDVTEKHYLHADDKDDLAASDMLGALLGTTMEGVVRDAKICGHGWPEKMGSSLALADRIQHTLLQIERCLRPTYPDGIPANVRIAELLRAYPGFSFVIYPTDPITGYSSLDVVPPDGSGFRLVIDGREA